MEEAKKAAEEELKESHPDVQIDEIEKNAKQAHKTDAPAGGRRHDVFNMGAAFARRHRGRHEEIPADEDDDEDDDIIAHAGTIQVLFRLSCYFLFCVVLFRFILLLGLVIRFLVSVANNSIFKIYILLTKTIFNYFSLFF